jgi:hypothetical protein
MLAAQDPGIVRAAPEALWVSRFYWSDPPPKSHCTANFPVVGISKISRWPLISSGRRSLVTAPSALSAGLRSSVCSNRSLIAGIKPQPEPGRNVELEYRLRLRQPRATQLLRLAFVVLRMRMGVGT